MFSYIASRFLIQFIEFEKSLQNVETLNKNYLLSKTEEFDFLEAVTKTFSQVLELKDSKDTLRSKILQYDGLLEIFLSIIFKKKNSTFKEDLDRMVNLLKSPLYFECLVKLSLSQEPELIFKSSLLMNSIIECLGEKEKIAKYQNLILDNSTLLLSHIQFCVSEVSVK